MDYPYQIDWDNADDINSIKHFIENEIEYGKKYFRYYDKRPYDYGHVNHICTIKTHDGYGHLDYDKVNNKVWLGICVSDLMTGLGMGKDLMRRLLAIADSEGIKEIWLSVDKDNEPAINLYKRFNFKIDSVFENKLFMRWTRDTDRNEC